MRIWRLKIFSHRKTASARSSTATTGRLLRQSAMKLWSGPYLRRPSRSLAIRFVFVCVCVCVCGGPFILLARTKTCVDWRLWTEDVCRLKTVHALEFHKEVSNIFIWSNAAGQVQATQVHEPGIEWPDGEQFPAAVRAQRPLSKAQLPDALRSGEHRTLC